MRRVVPACVIAAIVGGQLRSGPATTEYAVLFAEQLTTSVPVWTGSVRCEIDIKGPGYLNHLTHTWTLAGTLSPDGSPLDYPGTWSVTGSGSLQASATQPAATWKTQGAVAGVRMAIFVRQSDQKLLVFLRHAQLSAPQGTILVRALSAAPTATQVRNQQAATPALEWRPFPTIVDVPTSKHITGSSKAPITERLDATQPAGSEGQVVCSWDLVQGPGGSGSGAAPASGAASSAGAGGVAGGAAGGTAGAASAGARGAAPAGAGATTSAGAGAAVLAGGAASGAAGAAGGGAAGAAKGGAAGTAGAAAGGSAGAGAATNPSAPTAAGCDADIAIVACQLPAMSTGLTITYDANFNVATDTSDWYTVTATSNVSAGPFAVLDFSLTGGTADGSYSIEVSEGTPPASLKSVGNSGAAHAPKTTVAWSTASAANKTLFIQVRHLAGPPSNVLYSLRVSMSAAQTVPLTVVPLGPGVIGAIVPSTASKTGTVVPAKADTKALPATSGGTTSTTTIPQDGMPNTCAIAGNKVVKVSPGVFMLVTGAIEAAGVEDWLTVHFTSASVHVTLGGPVPIPGGSDFQITTFSTCSSPSSSPTTGGGIKTVDLPGSGPHDVIIRISASPWSATGATYSLRLEGK